MIIKSFPLNFIYDTVSKEQPRFIIHTVAYRTKIKINTFLFIRLLQDTESSNINYLNKENKKTSTLSLSLYALLEPASEVASCSKRIRLIRTVVLSLDFHALGS